VKPQDATAMWVTRQYGLVWTDIQDLPVSTLAVLMMASEK
jgi:hypothetical protein